MKNCPVAWNDRRSALAEKEDIDFSDWLGIVSEVVDEFDTEEVRGASIRLLEAYPNHAGLLSLRAITEALAVGGSETLIRKLGI